MDILDLLNDPTIKGAGGGGLAFALWYVLRFLMQYMTQSQSNDEKETAKEHALIDAAYKPLGDVSNALVSVVTTNEGFVVAIKELVSSLNDFRVDDVNQHNKTRDNMKEEINRQSDTLSQTFLKIQEGQQAIVEALQSIHKSSQDHDKTLKHIETQMIQLNNTMDKNDNGEILTLLQKILQKIEGLDSRVTEFTGDMRRELDIAKSEVQAIKSKVTQETIPIPQDEIEKEIENDHIRKQRTSDRNISGNRTSMDTAGDTAMASE